MSFRMTRGHQENKIATTGACPRAQQYPNSASSSLSSSDVEARNSAKLTLIIRGQDESATHRLRSDELIKRAEGPVDSFRRVAGGLRPASSGSTRNADLAPIKLIHRNRRCPELPGVTRCPARAICAHVHGVFSRLFRRPREHVGIRLPSREVLFFLMLLVDRFP